MSIPSWSEMSQGIPLISDLSIRHTSLYFTFAFSHAESSQSTGALVLAFFKGCPLRTTVCPGNENRICSSITSQVKIERSHCQFFQEIFAVLVQTPTVLLSSALHCIYFWITLILMLLGDDTGSVILFKCLLWTHVEVHFSGFCFMLKGSNQYSKKATSQKALGYIIQIENEMYYYT